MTLRRRLSRAERQLLFQHAAGQCQRCGAALAIERFHVAHLRAVASGGATTRENLEAWCVGCNLENGPRDAGDPRWLPRGWQREGLTDPDIVERIIRSGVATVAAAPGAGKTAFAAFVFEALYEADVVDRCVVFVPRAALVTQWRNELYRARHLDLTAEHEHERAGTLGTICTYQSLNDATVAVHRARLEAGRTLIIFDEVHHLGEPDTPTGQRPAWARYAMELAGELERLQVAGVLNLSGTLWRSAPHQRISTIRYERLDGQLLSLADLDITAARLIGEGQLRPVDLYRAGASVQVVDLRNATQIAGPIADLQDVGPARTVLRELHWDAEWRTHFVTAMIDLLKKSYQDLERAPVKGLIVASTQPMARQFQQTANAVMRVQGLQPFTELAISDEPGAARTLKRFKEQQRPGILVTCDMAGEGYDCPEIIGVGFATNKITDLYIRQVVARAQRVTDRERQRLGRPLPAWVVIPDVPLLEDRMKQLLTPMRHHLHDGAPPPDPHGPAGTGGPPLGPRYVMGAVTDLGEGDAHVVGATHGDVPMPAVRQLEPHLRSYGIPETYAPRVLVATREFARQHSEQHPFDPLSPEDQHLADLGAAPPRPALSRTPLADSDTAQHWQRELHRLERWWSVNGSIDIRDFATEANRAAGIPAGGRPQASLEQIRAAYDWAAALIQGYCAQTGQSLPVGLRGH